MSWGVYIYMEFKKNKNKHTVCPSFLVAASIFSVFTLTGIVSASWVDAPNTPPNYGIFGCMFPCLEEDFRPLNLSAVPQTKRAGVTFEGSVTADGMYDRQDPSYIIDPASSITSLNLAGHAVINADSSVIGAQLVVNNPKNAAKTGSIGDAIYAYASTTNAAISAEQENSLGYAIYSSGGDNYFQGNVGVGTENPSEKLDVNGVVRSSNGGFMFPDGTIQVTAASTGGLLMRAIHTFKDCVVQGGQVYTIDEGKNICRFSSLPAGWALYPANWTTTVNVVCNDTKDAPEGWESPPTRTPCNTGSHAFADLPTESCVATSTGTQCWYEGFFGSNKVCGSATTSTTCYATVTERGGY